MKIVEVKAVVKIPSTPNFFQCADSSTIPIEAVQEEGLREIGKAWTENLVESAKAEKPKCHICKGSGVDPQNTMRMCWACGGKGTKKAEEPEASETGALSKVLELYATTEHPVTQGFYQGLCIKAKECIDQQAAEIKAKDELLEWAWVESGSHECLTDYLEHLKTGLRDR